MAGFTPYISKLTYRNSYAANNHIHTNNFGFGLADVPNGELHRADGLLTVTNPFVITTGNNAHGEWLQIVGSQDTPIQPGKKYFDVSRMLVVSVNSSALFFLQFAFGEYSELPQKITTKDYTEIGFLRASASSQSSVQDFKQKLIPVGTKVWVRARCVGLDAKTVSFYFGIHEYDNII